MGHQEAGGGSSGGGPRVVGSEAGMGLGVLSDSPDILAIGWPHEYAARMGEFS